MFAGPLPTLAVPGDYEALAEQLLRALSAGDARAGALFRELHPRFRRPDVPWMARRSTDADIGEVDLVDARLAVARGHCFRTWDALVAFAKEVRIPGLVRRFETAADAVIDGDVDTLEALLREDKDLTRARSTRECCFDPPVHGATLLHYVAANGVENHRQRTPANAVEVAERLLRAGAEADALADFYGEPYTTMCLLISSSGPAAAGVQVPLVELLVSHGAAVDGRGPLGTTPLRTALVFGGLDAARALVGLGAEVRDLPTAAGLGDVDRARRFLPATDAADRHRALALAAQLGQLQVTRLLLDAGEDPNRYNPVDVHAHTTPLHSAALGGYAELVHLLVDRGASLELRDRIYDSTAAEWAEHAGHTEIATFLRERAKH